MEYVQRAIATCHDFGGADPPTDLSRVAVVVPVTERAARTPTASDVLASVAARNPARIVVPVQADADAIGPIADWLAEVDAPTDCLWCSAPALADRLAAAGIDTPPGKGRDVWLALGVAASAADRVAVHDADVQTYAPETLARLCFPLDHDYRFVKGYAARVESDGLYGRLFRLFVSPLLDALSDRHDAGIVRYLQAFRYTLSGSIATTAQIARSMRPPPGWGLEIATLGTAFERAGFEATAQVDLGRHVHDHRPVAGADGLERMAREVWTTLVDVCATHGVGVDPGALRTAYRTAADRLVDRYALDARFNGLPADPQGERDQIERYADAIDQVDQIDRLPAWDAIDLDPGTVRATATRAVRAELHR
ncbi:glycosyltransferase family protein [Halococcoides cellulosivorans]|uniref:Glycosyl transferase family 2 n=1 Tax=Halococcoides cellulosivorans TaxID=1679096 RepID=A0A2R4X4K5_9EURY|nr:glycosyl transferase family 2 [Halococcoides cellulosivorans]AWB28726.1 glycosyl transferase family 2 [Halococcoides cellulosivorans]